MAAAIKYTNFTKPLTAKTDALKLKELQQRFPLGDFVLTNIKSGQTKKVRYDFDTPSSWMDIMLYTDNNRVDYPFHCFSRPFKLTVTLLGVERDITHLIES